MLLAESRDIMATAAIMGREAPRLLNWIELGGTKYQLSVIYTCNIYIYVCVCVCVYIYICVCVYTHTHIYIYTYMCICVYIILSLFGG